MSELQIGVRDLKSRLSEYSRQVQQGKNIITNHVRPAGWLSPIEQPLDEQFKACQNAGVLGCNRVDHPGRSPGSKSLRRLLAPEE